MSYNRYYTFLMNRCKYNLKAVRTVSQPDDEAKTDSFKN